MVSLPCNFKLKETTFGMPFSERDVLYLCECEGKFQLIRNSARWVFKDLSDNFQ